MSQKKSSLKIQLAVGIAVLALVSSLISSHVASRFSREQIEHDQSALLQNMAVRMATQLAQDMSARGNEILFLANQDRIRDTKFPLEKKRDIFERMKQSYPFYAWIGIADQDGNIVAGTDGLLVGKSVAQREWFLKGKEELHFGDAHDAFLLAKLLPKPKWDDLPLRLVDVSAPVRDESGQFLGVICGHLSLDWAFEARNLMLDQLPLEGLDLVVLNKDGKILMGTPQLPSLKVDLSSLNTFQGLADSLRSVGIDVWPDSKKYLTAAVRETPFRNYPGMGWVIIGRKAEAAAFAPADHLSTLVLSVGVASTLGFVLLLWVMLSRKLKPLEEISAAAEQIRTQGTDVEIPRPVGDDEVATFARSLIGLVSELQESNAELKLASRVFEESGQGILISNAENKILRVNESFTRITGYRLADVVGNTPALLSSGQQDAFFYEKMWSSIRRTGGWQGEIWNRNKLGHVYPEWLTINTLKDEADQITHFIAIFDDISEKKEYEKRLVHLASYDQLTNLPNRNLMRRKVESMLKKAKRHGTGLALLFIDLDKFKHINDTLGHPAGDQVLRELAIRFQSQVGEENLLSRWGGDEFVLAQPNADEASVMLLIEKLTQSLERPFTIEGERYYISMSVGVAMYPSHGDSVDVLLRCADTAMYQAKREGMNLFRFYDSTMNASLERFLKIDNALKHALDHHGLGLALNFQPQFDSTGKQIVGIEALIRWNHPEMGAIGPNQFIPVAEETGQIARLGLWIIEEAARAYDYLRSHGCHPVQLSINCSAYQLNDNSVMDALALACATYDIPPGHLAVEITESAIMTDEQSAIEKLVKLGDAGHHISIDDFGTGYSCLTYIQKIKPAEIKIDQSFISKMISDSDSRNIVLFTINLAKSMGIVVVAEGVETHEQMQMLGEISQDVRLQGYLLSRPVALNDLALICSRSA